MEKQIRDYEKYIKGRVREIEELSFEEVHDLFRLHTETVRNFQHERLVHLLIMLFFVFLAVCLVFGTIIGIMAGWIFGGMFVALGVLDLLMVVLSVAYVKHYYFLENHIQGLYKYFEEIKFTN